MGTRSAPVEHEEMQASDKWQLYHLTHRMNLITKNLMQHASILGTPAALI